MTNGKGSRPRRRYGAAGMLAASYALLLVSTMNHSANLLLLLIPAGCVCLAAGVFLWARAVRADLRERGVI